MGKKGLRKIGAELNYCVASGLGEGRADFRADVAPPSLLAASSLGMAGMAQAGWTEAYNKRAVGRPHPGLCIGGAGVPLQGETS